MRYNGRDYLNEQIKMTKGETNQLLEVMRILQIETLMKRTDDNG